MGTRLVGHWTGRTGLNKTCEKFRAPYREVLGNAAGAMSSCENRGRGEGENYRPFRSSRFPKPAHPLLLKQTPCWLFLCKRRDSHLLRPTKRICAADSKVLGMYSTLQSYEYLTCDQAQF